MSGDYPWECSESDRRFERWRRSHRGFQKDCGLRRRQPARAPTAFVELMPQPVGASDCLIEVEGPRGKMRVQWNGATASDFAGLIWMWESA